MTSFVDILDRDNAARAAGKLIDFAEAADAGDWREAALALERLASSAKWRGFVENSEYARLHRLALEGDVDAAILEFERLACPKFYNSSEALAAYRRAMRERDRSFKPDPRSVHA